MHCIYGLPIRVVFAHTLAINFIHKEKFMKNQITKLKNLPYFLMASLATSTAFGQTGSGGGSGTAGTDIDVINNLGTTVKSLLENKGALVIDGIILAAAAYGTAVTKSPAPMVCGIVSCAVFHIAVKLILV
jgi:hypothetical protein